MLKLHTVSENWPTFRDDVPVNRRRLAMIVFPSEVVRLDIVYYKDSQLYRKPVRGGLTVLKAMIRCHSTKIINELTGKLRTSVTFVTDGTKYQCLKDWRVTRLSKKNVVNKIVLHRTCVEALISTLNDPEYIEYDM